MREYKKYVWLIESIIKEGTFRVSQIAARTGISRAIVDDCVWDLIQAGTVKVTTDSYLVWHCDCACHKHADVMHCVPCC